MTSSRSPERRQLTMMFCDMVDSTPLSVRLDPEELAEVIQAYRRRCTDIVTRHGGIIARHVGDGVLAYFGYPRAHENDAERAVHAALDAASAQWPAPAPADLAVRIGVATGIVVVGNLPDGGEDLSAIGSALNLAARLQTLAAPGKVVVSQQTRKLTGGLFDYRELGSHTLKGFDEPVVAYEVIGVRRVGSRFHALRPALTPLVDRVTEQAALRELWASVKAGTGRAVLLTSEPGVGKSRLAEFVAHEIVDEGSVRIWYHCSPTAQSSPLAPVIQQFAVAAGFTDHDDDATKLRKLEELVPESPDKAEIVPVIANLLSVRTEDRFAPQNTSPQRQKARVFDALMRSLASFSARGPLLLVIEDLHWIDPTSDELVGVVLRHLDRLPMLVVLTARPEFQSHWDDQGRIAHMTLSPLGRDDAITLIGLLCGERTIPQAAIAQIADKTDGLPLFIEDVTQEVLASGAVEQPSAIAIPTTLNASLMAKLDRLGSARAIAEMGAVIGREFSYDLLARVADLPEEMLRDQIYQLIDAGLIVRGRSTAALSYEFKHALVRDAAYASQLRKARIALHARVARILAEHFPDTAESQPEVLAQHFEGALEIDNAVDYLVRAAKLSARRSGFVEAIAHLDRALALLAKQPPCTERSRREVNAYRTLGGIYAEYKGFSSKECGGAYEAALALCRELPHAPEMFAVLSGLGSFEITRAAFDRCEALADECLARAEQQPSKPPFIMGHLLLGGTRLLKGELASARGHLLEALRLYEEDRAPRGRQVMYVQDQKSTGLAYLALTHALMGDVALGVEAGEQGLAHSRALGGLHTVNYSLCYLAAAHYICGNTQRARELATESLSTAREQEFATWIGISQIVRGAALVREGAIDEGVAELRNGMAAHAAMEATAYRPFAEALFVEGLIAAGDLVGAQAALARALELIATTGEMFYAAEIWRLKGLVAQRQRRPDEEAAALAEAARIAQRQDARLFERRIAGGAR